MTYDGSSIIRDQNDNPIPQQWDDENQEWKAYGEMPTKVQQSGSIVTLKKAEEGSIDTTISPGNYITLITTSENITSSSNLIRIVLRWTIDGERQPNANEQRIRIDWRNVDVGKTIEPEHLDKVNNVTSFYEVKNYAIDTIRIQLYNESDIDRTLVGYSIIGVN